MEKKYNFVYQTKNLINGKLYIGVHSTDNLNDGYIGCGITSQGNANSKGKRSPFIRAVRKYGYENFKMIPMCFFKTKKEAYEEEAWLVNEEWINSDKTYNVKLGGNINRQRKGSLERKNHGFSKKVRNKITGEVYDSIQTVSELLGMKHSTLSNKLKGRCFNDTDYEFYDNHLISERLKAPNNIKYKNIQRFNLNGELIGTYRYLRDLDNGIVCNVRRAILKPEKRVAGGSLWRAEDVYTGDIVGFKDEELRFKVYSKDGKLVKNFYRLNDLLKFLGYSRNSGSRVLDSIKNGKLIKGYVIHDNK